MYISDFDHFCTIECAFAILSAYFFKKPGRLSRKTTLKNPPGRVSSVGWHASSTFVKMLRVVYDNDFIIVFY